MEAENLTQQECDQAKEKAAVHWAEVMTEIEIAVSRLPACLKKDVAIAKVDSLAKVIEQIFRADWKPSSKRIIIL